jgi:hypothetical protein
MIKIFEGTDATGKTTAARSFADRYSARYIHAGAPSQATWREEYVDSLRELADNNASMAIDRWHLGELVWPTVFGRESLFKDDDEFKACCQALGELGAELVVVFRDEASILATLEQRGELDTADGVLAGQRMFLDKVALVSGMPVSVVSSDALFGGTLWS